MKHRKSCKPGISEKPQAVKALLKC